MKSLFCEQATVFQLFFFNISSYEIVQVSVGKIKHENNVHTKNGKSFKPLMAKGHSLCPVGIHKNTF
jgi:hypothetical protein